MEFWGICGNAGGVGYVWPFGSGIRRKQSPGIVDKDGSGKMFLRYIFLEKWRALGRVKRLMDPTVWVGPSMWPSGREAFLRCSQGIYKRHCTEVPLTKAEKRVSSSLKAMTAGSSSLIILRVDSS